MTLRARTLLLLALLALISAGLAGWAWWRARAPLAVAGQGEPLLPGLARRLNEVAVITVRRGDSTLTLRRGADGRWRAGEAAWPVPAAQVRSVLLTLAEMKKVRPATALPRRYRFIKVDDPGPGSDAVQLTLKDSGGRVLADIIPGREMQDWLGGGRTAQFVRLTGQRQAWLVEGSVRAPLRITAWADATLLKLPLGKLAEVEITRDGETLKLLANPRADGGDAAKAGAEAATAGDDPWRALPLRLADAPPGARPRQDTVRQLARALSDLAFLDVRKDAFLRGHEPLSTLRARWRDGLTIALRTFRLREKGKAGGYWITGRMLAPGGDEKMAEKLRKRFNGRAFRVYDSIGAAFSARLQDVIRAEMRDLERDLGKDDAPPRAAIPGANPPAASPSASGKGE